MQQNVNAGALQQPAAGTPAAGKSAAQPPTDAPKTAPESQPKNIVTSWAAREDTSTKKKQERQHTVPAKSVSKTPACPSLTPAMAPPVAQQGSAAPSGTTGLQGAKEQGGPGARPVSHKAHPAPSPGVQPGCIGDTDVASKMDDLS